MTTSDVKELAFWFAKWVGFAVALTVTIGLTPFGRDNTDVEGWGGGRSGMVPMVDNLTGCQYLRTANGGITPRIDAKGNQVGCKR